MKVVVILLNVYALGFIIVGCALEMPTGSELLLVLSFAAVPIVNLFYIYCGNLGASWLGMFFKRKRLEEQKRIEALEKQPCTTSK